MALDDLDAGIRLVTATSGRDALAMLNEADGFQPDFIFLDLNMPKMDGKECLTKMRQLRHLHQTPIIVYTTSRAEAHRDETLQLGATYFFTKPVDLTDLSRTLANVFQGNYQ